MFRYMFMLFWLMFRKGQVYVDVYVNTCLLLCVCFGYVRFSGVCLG